MAIRRSYFVSERPGKLSRLEIAKALTILGATRLSGVSDVNPLKSNLFNAHQRTAMKREVTCLGDLKGFAIVWMISDVYASACSRIPYNA